MGRRRASRRTTEQKLNAVSKAVKKEGEELRDTLVSRREVLELIERGVQAYDERYVAEFRAIAEWLAMPWWRRLKWRFDNWRNKRAFRKEYANYVEPPADAVPNTEVPDASAG